MIITNLLGGLGNQLFQFACGAAAAHRNGVPLRIAVDMFAGYALHRGPELTKVFQTGVKECTAAELRQVIGWRRHPSTRKVLAKLRPHLLMGDNFVAQPGYRFWPEIFSAPEQSYLHGYWQSELFFVDHAAHIRNELKFKPLPGPQNAALMEYMGKSNSVSVHVRRGDYVIGTKNQSLYATCSLDYYANAIRYISQRVSKAEFFVFSDDPEWVRATLLPLTANMRLIEHNRGSESFNDMRLMSSCQHHIIANSTFSWWGAWLNPSLEKIVVAPAQWLHEGLDWPEVTPSEWVRM